MALFFRVFISLFLFSNSAHAVGMGGSNTYKYYQSANTANTCNISPDPFCTEALNAQNNAGRRQDSCGEYVGFTDCIRQTDGTCYYSSNYAGYVRASTEKSLTCEDGYHLKLVGCTATCEGCPAGSHSEYGQCLPDVDPCESRKDAKASSLAQCGTASCPSGGHFVADGGFIKCSNGRAFFAQTPQNAVVIDGCAAISPTSSSGASVKNSSIGSSSTTAYCTSQYTYTGVSATPQQPISDLALLQFTGVTPTTPDGTCPDGTVKGSFGSGETSTFICVPDPGGSNSGDGSGSCNDGSAAVNGVCGDGSNPSNPNPTGGTCSNGSAAVNGVCADGSTPSGSGSSGDTVTPKPGAGNSSSAGETTHSSAGGGSGSCSTGCTATTSSKCDTPPTCNGDPLVCASISQQWLSTCRQTEALTAISTEDAEKANENIASSKAALNAAQNTANTQSNSFFSNFQSAVSSGSHTGQCIADASLSVMSRSLVIPFSKACEFFKFLRMLVITLAYLAASKIIFKGAS